MTVVAYFVHGRGRGHASRARSIVPHLRANGFDVRVFGGGRAQETLETSPRFTPARPVMPGSPVRVGRDLAARLPRDIRRLREHEAQIVVTDGDMPSGLAAHLVGIPVVAVGHGLLFRHCKVPASLPRLPVLREALNAWSGSIGARRKVVVHFAPLVPRGARIRVARPDGLDALSEGPVRDDGFVLAYFRDNDGHEILERVVRSGRRVLCFGTPQGFGKPALSRGVELHAPEVDAFRHALTRCSAVVGSAGSNLISECLAARKPLLAVHAPRDVEQRLNAKMVEEAGVGIGCNREDVTDAVIARLLSSGAPRTDAWDAMMDLAPASEAVREAIDAALDEATHRRGRVRAMLPLRGRG